MIYSKYSFSESVLSLHDFHFKKIQRNLDIMKGQRIGKMCLLQLTRFRYIVVFIYTYFTITGVKKIVRYTEDCVS